MVDLSNISGLSIFLDWQHQRLRFADKIRIETTKQRIVREMRDVLLDQPSISDTTTLYVMYDGVRKKNGSHSGSDARLRYDLTLIFPGQLGRELIKTAGHYHSISQDVGLSYPELYEVLYGEVHFIMQSPIRDAGEIEDLVLIRAYQGQKVMVPPNYGHVAINPLSKPLVLANWIARDCKPDYTPLSRFNGAAVFEINEGSDVRFVENEKYVTVPPLREVEISSTFQFNDIGSLFELLAKNPDCLQCLLSPQETLKDFENYIGREIRY